MIFLEGGTPSVSKRFRVNQFNISMESNGKVNVSAGAKFNALVKVGRCH